MINSIAKVDKKRTLQKERSYPWIGVHSIEGRPNGVRTIVLFDGVNSGTKLGQLCNKTGHSKTGYHSTTWSESDFEEEKGLSVTLSNDEDNIYEK